MNAPEKCPKCGAEFKDTEDLVVVYECGTECFTSDGRIYFRSIECHERVLIQRDALAKRVKRLEEAGDKLAAIVGQKGDPTNWVDEPVCDEALEAWNQAKATKP